MYYLPLPALLRVMESASSVLGLVSALWSPQPSYDMTLRQPQLMIRCALRILTRIGRSLLRVSLTSFERMICIGTLLVHLILSFSFAVSLHFPIGCKLLAIRVDVFQRSIVTLYRFGAELSEGAVLVAVVGKMPYSRQMWKYTQLDEVSIASMTAAMRL